MDLNEEANALKGGLSDADLVIAAQKDKASFTPLVRRYYGFVLNYVRRKIDDEHTAEDVVQETFFRAYSAIGKCQRPEGFSLWLFEIARNCMREHFRKDRHQSVSIDQGIDLVSESREAQNKCIAEEERIMLGQTFLTLSESKRNVVVMKHQEGKSCREIASILNRPVGTITRLLSEAYAELAEKLEPYFSSHKRRS